MRHHINRIYLHQKRIETRKTKYCKSGRGESSFKYRKKKKGFQLKKPLTMWGKGDY